MWRSCWGALLSAGLLCTLAAGQGLGGASSGNHHTRVEEVRVVGSSSLAEAAKVACDARAGQALLGMHTFGWRSVDARIACCTILYIVSEPSTVLCHRTSRSDC